jgi:hypothetical protein
MSNRSPVRSMLRHAGLGIIAGAICGLLVFETALMVLFASGRTSSYSLTTEGPLLGLVVGAVSGISISIFRVRPWTRAGILAMAFTVLYVLGYGMWALKRPGLYPDSISALVSITQAAVLLFLLTATTAGATPRAVQWLEYLFPEEPAPVRSSSATGASGGVEKRYRL